MKSKYFFVILFLILAMFLFFSIVGLSNEVKYDFRKTNWGMNREQVKEIEKSRLVVENFGKEESLIYEGEIDGLDGQIFYYFMRGKLIKARYVIRRPSINDYEKLKEYFIKKYGKPVEDWIHENNHRTSWDTPVTEICLSLTEPVDNIFRLWIYHESKELKELADSIKTEKDTALKQSKYQYDFRKTNWGMSKEQVKATEDKEPDDEYEFDAMLGYDEDITVISYDVTISGKDFNCTYSFLEDKLYNGRYFFTGDHADKNLYIDDYEELKEILTKKYGKPMTDKMIWMNDLYKNDKSHWGMAIDEGDLIYETVWETPTKRIYLELSNGKFGINLTLSYLRKELIEWIDKIKEEKDKQADKIEEEKAKYFF